MQILDIVRTSCRVVRTDCRDFPNSVDSWKQTPCWILIDRASGRCCSDVRTSSMFICRTLQGVRTPSKARQDGFIGTGWFVLIFAMDTSWVSSRSLWAVNVSMYEDSNLKTDCQIYEDWKNRLSCNHYIKCFCLNQNVANKNTNNLRHQQCCSCHPISRASITYKIIGSEVKHKSKSLSLTIRSNWYMCSPSVHDDPYHTFN